jgi:hypothetical protein
VFDRERGIGSKTEEEDAYEQKIEVKFGDKGLEENIYK